MVLEVLPILLPKWMTSFLCLSMLKLSWILFL